MPANQIDPGTIACVPGTMSGDIYAIFASLIGAPISQIESGMKRLSFVIADGIVSNIVASIDDTKILQVSGGVIQGASSSAPPPAHAPSHEDGGSDELDVTGLSGLLADPQVPTAHASTHEDGGSDEIRVTGLSGLLADQQNPTAHASTHEDGGSDQISVAGLSGLLATAQTPTSHASTHQSGGADAIKLDDLAAPDDNTDLNASATAHGLLLKLTMSATDFLRADGTWAAPAGGSGLTHPQVLARTCGA